MSKRGVRPNKRMMLARFQINMFISEQYGKECFLKDSKIYQLQQYKS